MNISSKQQEYLADAKICITAQGLPDDVFNVWYDLQINIQLIELAIEMNGEDAALSTDYKSAMDAINIPRQTYEEYANLKLSPEFRRQIQDLLNSSSIKSFNELVREFNALATERRVTVAIAHDFVRRAATIIQGN